MISLPQGLKGKGTFARGVHPPERKELAASAEIEVLPVPAEPVIPLHQHAGAPCEAVVKTKDEVQWGDLLADSEAFISAPVHASVPGVVGRETVCTLPNGRHVAALPIKTAEDAPSGDTLWNEVYGGHWTTAGLDDMDPSDIADKVKAAGIVGHGGAAFPTYVKLLRNDDKPVDTLLVNGCECEPYLTADDRLMRQAPAPIVTGAMLAARAAGAKRIVIALENNKPEAADVLRKAVEGTTVDVAVLKTKYPMGGEKQTVRAALDRTIPTGGLPLDVGVVVINVATAAAIARAVLRGKPFTHRIISVTGNGITTPKNILAPVGASYADLIACCGGLRPDCARVIAGGPMMGFALGDLHAPVTKGTSGIVCLTGADVKKTNETSCVRCGRCIDVCPLNLEPTRLALASRAKDWDLAKKYHLSACMECGCCAYVCPAAIPLVQLMRMGKVQMRKE